MKTALRNQRKFTGLLFSSALLVFSLWITGCKESAGINSTTPTSSSKANVRTFTGIKDRSVTSSGSFGKAPSIMGIHSTADSLVITRARVVISTLKLYRMGVDDADTIIVVKDDDNGHGHGNGMGNGKGKKDKDEDEKDTIIVIDRNDGTLRVGPLVAEFNDSGEKILSEVTIPSGTYDKVKFEIHKLNENDDPALLNDSLFGDFVNGGRYTFIVEGISYVNGVGYPFDFKSSITANVSIDLNPPVLLDSTHHYDLRLVFDPKIVFSTPGTKPLDPRDPDNQEAIEQMLRQSIRLLK
ncbi:MAG: hypothetical protein ACHQM6_06650 [Candidatus Kapaibacterium sp.]